MHLRLMNGTDWQRRVVDFTVGPQSLLLEVGIEDLPRWEKAAAAIHGLLTVMADASDRRHRTMTTEDWNGLLDADGSVSE